MQSVSESFTQCNVCIPFCVQDFECYFVIELHLIAACQHMMYLSVFVQHNVA